MEVLSDANVDVFSSGRIQGGPKSMGNMCDAGSASDYVEFSNFMGLDRKYTRQCGQLTPFEVESERKFFRVTFRSNDRLDGTGFNASFLFIEDPTPSPTPQPTSAAVVHLLGQY
ncbi:unnamed protein product, partial [Nezara viridula]